MPDRIADPVEKMVEETLILIGMPYEREYKVPNSDHRIDFYLPVFNVYIECKQFNTPRTISQMEAVKNIIVIQGMEAAYLFSCMIRRGVVGG